MRLSELKVLYEVFCDTRFYVSMAIESINHDYVTIDDFMNGDFFQHRDRYYSSEEYVLSYSGDLLDKEQAFYCQGYDEWFDDSESVIVYEHRSESSYSNKWAMNHDNLYEYRGDYYDRDALSYHDLVIAQDTDTIMPENEAYYHPEESEYYSYPPEDDEQYTREYHNGRYRTKIFDNKSNYRIGYEIEKEDGNVLESIGIEDFEDRTDNIWRKEKDGSLNEENGYELISPTFEFNIDKIFKLIEGNDILVRHINADTSYRCGGHIHLSQVGLSGEQLFDKIKGYTPLFYALYYGRVNKSYCKGKNNDDLKQENEKYQAIKIHNDRVEFRIISAVYNVNTLKWRTKLLMMILQNPTSDIIRAYYNVDTKFTKLLKQTYSDDKLLILKQRFIDFTAQFEGLDINKK